MAGHRLTLTIRKEKRGVDANAKLHAMLTYFSKNLEWAGKKRDVDVWKRLMVAAWCRANNEAVELLPAVDGAGVDIVYRKTSELTGGECADLIEFIFSWGAANDFPVPDIKRLVDPETGEVYLASPIHT